MRHFWCTHSRHRRFGRSSGGRPPWFSGWPPSFRSGPSRPALRNMPLGVHTKMPHPLEFLFIFRYNLLMRDIIENTRKNLVPFLGPLSAMPLLAPGPVLSARYAAPVPYSSNTGRFIRKIPKANYEKLAKFVPINWL